MSTYNIGDEIPVGAVLRFWEALIDVGLTKGRYSFVLDGQFHELYVDEEARLMTTRDCDREGRGVIVTGGIEYVLFEKIA